jgi:hypothetical protein
MVLTTVSQVEFRRRDLRTYNQRRQQLLRLHLSEFRSGNGSDKNLQFAGHVRIGVELDG